MQEGNQVLTDLQDGLSEKISGNSKLTEKGILQLPGSMTDQLNNLLNRVKGIEDIIETLSNKTDVNFLKSQKSEYSKRINELEKQIRIVEEKKKELENRIDQLIIDKTGDQIVEIVENTLTSQVDEIIKPAVDKILNNQIDIKQLVVEELENQFDTRIEKIDVLELNDRLRLIENIASKFDNLKAHDIDIGEFVLNKIPQKDIDNFVDVLKIADEDGREINLDYEIERFGSIESKVEDLDYRLFSVEEKMTDYFVDEFNSEIDKLRSKIHAIEMQLSMDKVPAEFEFIYKRFHNCISISNRNIDKDLSELNLDPHNITEQLEQRGYFIDESKVNEIVVNLKMKRMVILEGAPGSGKTRLAELLSEIVLQRNTQNSYTLASVDPEWTKFDCIGGLCKKGNHFGPYIGKLTEAILKSIESKGMHWLILDEFNRGDINGYLTSILSGMPLEEGVIEFDHAFYGNNEPSAKLRMPRNFRIICTMNSYDKNHLYKMPGAFYRRSGKIQISKPTIELERKIIDFKRALFLNKIKEKKNESDKINENIHNLINFVANKLIDIRHVGSIDSGFLFEPCNVSMGTIINIFNAINFEIEKSAVTGNLFLESDILGISDTIFHTVYSQELLSNHAMVFQRLMENVFPEKTFPQTFNGLQQKMKSVKLF